MKKGVSRSFPHSPSLWGCGKGVGMGVGSLKIAKSDAISAVFKKCGKCGNNFQETENFMEFQNVFQEMLNVTAAPPAPPPNPAAAALQRADIPTDAPYYAGAFRNGEQALASRSPWRSGRRTCLACADIWSDWNERQSRRTSRRNANSCGAGFVLCRRCCMRCRKRNEQRTNREKPTRR